MIKQLSRMNVNLRLRGRIRMLHHRWNCFSIILLSNILQYPVMLIRNLPQRLVDHIGKIYVWWIRASKQLKMVMENGKRQSSACGPRKIMETRKPVRARVLNLKANSKKLSKKKSHFRRNLNKQFLIETSTSRIRSKTLSIKLLLLMILSVIHWCSLHLIL